MQCQFDWTERDWLVLKALALDVRVLSVRQAARLWWTAGRTGEGKATERLKKLMLAGFVERYRVEVYPALRFDEPEYRWRPGNPLRDEPFFDSLVGYHKTQRRGRRLDRRFLQEEQPIWLYVATEFTRNLFASYGHGLPDQYDRNHDYQMAELFVAFHTSRLPRTVQGSWLGEDALPKAGKWKKDPDAWLCDESGNRREVLEFIGSGYDGRRLLDLHRYLTRECDPPVAHGFYWGRAA